MAIFIHEGDHRREVSRKSCARSIAIAATESIGVDFNDLTIDELREQASRLRLCLPYSDIEACRERAEELIEEGEALQNTIAFIVLIERRIKELEDEGTEISSCCY